MKTVKLLMLIFVLSAAMYAQSDYEKVQNFKKELSSFQGKIERADSAAVLDSLQAELNDLKKKYKNDVELLNKSLYPDDYNTSVAKVENAIKLRRTDFTQIEELVVEVGRLKGEMEKLNDKNTDLLSEIKRYQAIGGSPEQVQNLISQLRKTLKQRDELVREMVDSLLIDFVNHPMTLNEAEKQEVYDKIETGKLFYNIEKTIRDNMEFLRVTTLKPDDLGEVKEDQVQFFRLWKKVGPKIADTYSGTKNKSGEVAYINNLFSQWEQKVDNEIWKDVQTVFVKNNIDIEKFDSGEEFVDNVTAYIQEQMESFDKLGYDESYNNYTKFADDVWKEDLRSSWLPILVDNEMLTVDQYEAVNTKIDEWESIYDVESSTWWYFIVIIVVVVLLIAGFVFRKSAKKKRLKDIENKDVES